MTPHGKANYHSHSETPQGFCFYGGSCSAKLYSVCNENVAEFDHIFRLGCRVATLPATVPSLEQPIDECSAQHRAHADQHALSDTVDALHLGLSALALVSASAGSLAPACSPPTRSQGLRPGSKQAGPRPSQSQSRLPMASAFPPELLRSQHAFIVLAIAGCDSSQTTLRIRASSSIDISVSSLSVVALCGGVSCCANQAGGRAARPVPNREHLFPAVHQIPGAASQSLLARCGRARRLPSLPSARRSPSAPQNSGSQVSARRRSTPSWPSSTKSENDRRAA